MVQRQLPMFPEGSITITHDLAVQKREGQVTYFYGTLPIFTHDETDDASFQMITAQFYTNGYVKQMDIVRAFGAPISVKRAVKRYKEQGVQGFYAEKKIREAAVLTDEVLKRAQHLLKRRTRALRCGRSIRHKARYFQQSHSCWTITWKQ